MARLASLLLLVLLLCEAHASFWNGKETLPGGYELDDELFYTGPMRYHSVASLPMFSQYTMQPPLIHGVKGKVSGRAADGSDDALSMTFAALFNAVLDIKLTDLSREKPPPPDIKWLVAGIVGFFGLIIIVLLAIFLCVEDDKPQKDAESEAEKSKEVEKKDQ